MTQVIIVEVCQHPSGGKLLLVQSIVKLCNHTDSPLQIAVLSRQNDIVWDATIRPNQHVSLPTTLRGCYALAVRPAGGSPLSSEWDDLPSAGAQSQVSSGNYENSWENLGDGQDQIRGKQWEWSERVLLPLMSQPSSVDYSLVRCEYAGREEGGQGGTARAKSGREEVHGGKVGAGGGEGGAICLRVRVDAKRPEAGGEGGSVRAVISFHSVSPLPIIATSFAGPIRPEAVP